MAIKKQQSKGALWLRKMRAGKKYFQQGQPDKAVKSFSGAAKLCPERAEGWVNLASAQLEAARYAQARTAVERALSLQPELMVAHMILGDVLKNLGQWPEAFAQYRIAVLLERTPLSLNKLACALRVEHRLDEAQSLFLEAIALAPDFTLARLNLATLAIEQGDFEHSHGQLTALGELSLPLQERQELESAKFAVSEYFRLNEAITALCDTRDFNFLETLLRNVPEHTLEVDENCLAAMKSHAASARRITLPPALTNKHLSDECLSQEWPLIEALFMIPHVRSVNEYLAVKASLEQGPKAEGDLLESLNMESAIIAARKSQHDLTDPVKAELHIRNWHALACRNVDGLMPGHFKYTQNWSRKAPLLRRVDPARTSGTFRRFVSDYYHDAPPGIARAAVVCMTVCDLHAFADGNGRIGITWLNRELEWAGLAPALFSAELGIKGKLGDARRAVRSNRGDLSSLIAVITEAQKFGIEFCGQLAKARKN